MLPSPYTKDVQSIKTAVTTAKNLCIIPLFLSAFNVKSTQIISYYVNQFNNQIQETKLNIVYKNYLPIMEVPSHSRGFGTSIISAIVGAISKIVISESSFPASKSLPTKNIGIVVSSGISVP